MQLLKDKMERIREAEENSRVGGAGEETKREILDAALRNQAGGNGSCS
jgi:hypothetical protein